MALYQQGTQRIEIIVKKESNGTGDTGNKEQDLDQTTDKNGGGGLISALTGSTNPQRQRRVIKTNLTHALAVSKQIVDLGIEHHISGLGYQNGDQAYQQRVSRRMEVFKDTTNLASSIGMGALYGSWGGPIGAVLGMSFAAISTGTSLATKYAGRQRDYDYKIFKEQNAIEYNRSRAGINLTTGRLR